jgi:hypothetical protein
MSNSGSDLGMCAIKSAGHKQSIRYGKRADKRTIANFPCKSGRDWRRQTVMDMKIVTWLMCRAERVAGEQRRRCARKRRRAMKIRRAHSTQRMPAKLHNPHASVLIQTSIRSSPIVHLDKTSNSCYSSASCMSCFLTVVCVPTTR